MLRRIVFASAVLLASPAPAEERLTMEQTVKQALDYSPAVRAARARSVASEDQSKSHRGRLLPSIYLSDEQQHWNEPFAIALGPAPAPAIVARNVNTNTFVAAANQPVLGLLHLTSEQSALSSVADAAQSDVKTAEAALREEVQTQFLRLFEARALVGIAKASQEQLQEQIQVAKEKQKAGVLTTADVLRLEVAQANARQQEIGGRAAEQIARANLLTVIGRAPNDREIDFQEPQTPESPQTAPQELSPLLEQARAKRPEIASANSLASAAGATARGRGFDLLPELNLEAGYTHLRGQLFAPEDAAFVGLKAEWLVWDWGAKYFAHRAANAQAAAARASADDVRRRVDTEVAARQSNVEAAAAALEAARTAIASAEEAYRVTSVMLNAGSASTTDVLDAQSALTQARLNFARARYEYAISKIALARSLGEGGAAN